MRYAWSAGVLSFAACMLALMGCGEPPAGQVSGEVKYKGTAIQAGSITFMDEKGKVGYGQITDGKYQIDKAPLGEVKIGVQSSSGGGGGAAASAMAKSKGMPKDLPAGVDPNVFKKAFEKGTGVTIPAKYSDPQTSGLTYTVKQGQQTHNIDIP